LLVKDDLTERNTPLVISDPLGEIACLPRQKAEAALATVEIFDGNALPIVFLIALTVPVVCRLIRVIVERLTFPKTNE
jgi:hypothetical protein